MSSYEERIRNVVRHETKAVKGIILHLSAFDHEDEIHDQIYEKVTELHSLLLQYQRRVMDDPPVVKFEPCPVCGKLKALPKVSLCLDCYENMGRIALNIIENQ